MICIDLDLKDKGTIKQIYGPKERTEISKMEEFYEELQNIMEEARE